MENNIIVRPLRDDQRFVKCPRCRKHHVIKDNFDYLCDSCCLALLDMYPAGLSDKSRDDMDIVEAIRKSFAYQRKKYNA
jgi:hypothetical protein